MFEHGATDKYMSFYNGNNLATKLFLNQDFSKIIYGVCLQVSVKLKPCHKTKTLMVETEA